MSVNQSLKIYIPDATYGQDEWETESPKFQKLLADEYQSSFKAVDIGTGAGEPAFVTQIFEWWPVAGTAVIFFSGKKIKENLEAWTKIFKKLKPFFKHSAVFDRDGAAVLAIEAVRVAFGKMPNSLRLVAYHTDSALNQPIRKLQNSQLEISGIAKELDRVRGATIHVFEIEADEHLYQVFVQGSTVLTLKMG